MAVVGVLFEGIEGGTMLLHQLLAYTFQCLIFEKVRWSPILAAGDQLDGVGLVSSCQVIES
jgi:hypothetical protein